MLLTSADLLNVVDWSRAQFAMTAIYHWLFVPLTLGLGPICAIMETMYVRTGDESWKRMTKFWMRLFGINFAAGVATGLILEFEFGTNWSNYSHFVGDIFGAPLAIEGIIAFFMEGRDVLRLEQGLETLPPHLDVAHRDRGEPLGAVDPRGQRLDAKPRRDGFQPRHGAKRDDLVLGCTLLALGDEQILAHYHFGIRARGDRRDRRQRVVSFEKPREADGS